jgi:predicted phosphodiesterase
MKIGLIADVHANLPALEAVLAALDAAGVDATIFLGDAIAIGPQPAECLSLLLDRRRTRYIMGNHDAWFVHGLPRPQPAWMSDGEVAQQRWTHAQLNETQRRAVARWPWQIVDEFGGVRLAFQHYAFDEAGRGFAWAGSQPPVADLDRLFSEVEAAAIFYGHDHVAANVRGQIHYVNPGAAGCQPRAVAPFAIVHCEDGKYAVTHHQAPYDDGPLRAAYESRQVPERRLLYRLFHGDRWP